ncbi:MAG: tRNA pseudouridine(13) synthase TruD [Gammaproteobacteria bacterium]
MLEQAIHTLAFAHGKPPACGQIRQVAEDFRVTEIPLIEPAGAGEHVWVQVQKRNANTPVIAERLASVAGVHPRKVSFAGMKDRHAVTEQWFSVHLPGRDDPDWTQLDDDNTRVLAHARHGRKLQRGALRGNAFRLVIREVTGDVEVLGQRLHQVCTSGVPNYFGAQRFGRDGSNLQTAERLFANPRLRLSRNQRSMALSSMRSLLFNRVLSERVAMDCWDRPVTGDAMQLEGSHSFFIADAIDDDLLRRVREHDIHPTGPLCGQGTIVVTGECLDIENRVLAAYADNIAGLAAAGLRNDRRALRVMPGDFTWNWPAENCLELMFSLPAGSYATAVLRELIEYRE